MSLGLTLKTAREAKGQTLSQVAEATRMMVQVVEDLEREDFRRVAAPIYGRGFIKLYAEYLGLDPEPLIQEFMEIYTGSRPPQVMRRPAADEGQATEAPAAEQAEAGATPSDPAAAPALSAPASASERTAEQPDLFSVAAGRSAAVPSIAEPARSGETTPPRVRPAVEALEKKPVTIPAAQPVVAAPTPAPASPAAAAPRPAPREPQRFVATSWLPAGWTPARLAGWACGVVLLLLVVALVVHAVRRHRHHSAPARQAPAAAILQRAQPVPEPYFD